MISIQGDRAALERELRGVDAGEEKPKKAKASAGGSEYYRAKRIVEEWGRPLAFSGTGVFEFDPTVGWTDASAAVLDKCNRAMGRNSEKGCYAVLCNLVAVPADGALYHKLIDRKWVPFSLKPTEVLFSDYRYDVVEDLAEKIPEPVWGPRIMAPLAYSGDEAPRCTDFEAMVAGALPDPEIRRHFQEVVSLVLVPHVHLRGQIVLWGLPGSRKSSIATAIACAPGGIHGASWVQEARLVRCKWASAAIHGRFANVSNDSPVHRDWPGWIKEYSSGTYTVEAKYGQPRSEAVTAKLISTCNQMQSLEDASGAASDRLIPFRFDVVANRGSGVDRDQWMSPVFWSETERRHGVLTWLLEGLTRLQQRGRFVEPPQWLAQRSKAIAEGDPIQAAILAGATEVDDSDAFVSTADLLNLVPGLSGPDDARRAQRLAGYIERLFPSAIKTRRKVGGRDTRGYVRIRLLD